MIENNNNSAQPQIEDIDRAAARIKVVGVGGAGCNAVNRMIIDHVEGVEFVVANTDAQVLKISQATTKILLGYHVTQGLGAGANPEIGRSAALESADEVRRVLQDTDMVFIACGMGGGTGTGGAPVIAKVAKELGALTIGIITTPFAFESRTRSRYAREGLINMRRHVDSLIVIDNDRILEVIGDVPLQDSFREADNILRQAVQTITDLIATPSLINLDYADVRTVMEKKGNALFGIGQGEGSDRAVKAAQAAIVSPLLGAHIKGASDAIVNVTGGKKMTLNDAYRAVDVIRQNIGQEANIIFGVAINEALQDQIIVTFIATGFRLDSKWDLSDADTEPTEDITTSVSEQSTIAPQQPKLNTEPQPRDAYADKEKPSSPMNNDSATVQTEINDRLHQFSHQSRKKKPRHDLPDFINKKFSSYYSK